MKRGGLPEITDRFTNKTEQGIRNGELEGGTPSENTVSIGHGYKVTIHGEVIGQKGIPLTPIFRKGKRPPFVIIKTKVENTGGNIKSKDKEIRINGLMEKHFGHYIEGYAEMVIHKNKKYIAVPKDGNWNDMSISNLEYVIEKEYNLNGTKKSLLLQLIPYFLKEKNDEDLAALLSTSVGRVNRVRTELKNKGRIGNNTLNDLIISHKTYEIYVALLESKGLKSNLDIAKKLRPHADFKNKDEKDSLSDKVSRVRKKLVDKELIEKYNTYQQEVNIADKREELTEALLKNRVAKEGNKKTHAEIAEAFGLKKEQVDNFSRQIKKQEEKKKVEQKMDIVQEERVS